MKNEKWGSPGNKATGQTHIYITYSCWDFVPRKDRIFLDESGASHPTQGIKPAYVGGIEGESGFWEMLQYTRGLSIHITMFIIELSIAK